MNPRTDTHTRQRVLDDAKQRLDRAHGALEQAEGTAERALVARNDAKQVWLDARDAHRNALQDLLDA